MANDETCAFCGRSGVKMSDEHVVLHSLKYLASPGAYLRHHTAYIDSETGEGRTHSWSDRNKSGYDATVRICKDCNTKILNNRIEKPFQVNLKAMVEGDAVALDSDAVTRMATWAAKTVMTRELLDKGMGDLSIPEWQYRWLHDYVSPPQTMLMYFGKAEYAPDKWDRHRRFRAVVDGEHLGGTEGFITSFVIGHFWFIVAGFADEDIFDAFKDSIDEFYTQHHLRSLARFWPPETVDGFVSDPVPQNFPPGPEAPAALVVRASFGPKSLKLRVDGQVVREIHTQGVPLPPPVATEL